MNASRLRNFHNYKNGAVIDHLTDAEKGGGGVCWGVSESVEGIQGYS